MITARTVAAQVLVRVVYEGAFAAAALDAELERAAQLDARDRGLATEIVYGTLRLRGYLYAALERHAPRGLDSLPPIVLAHLMVAAYQMLVLTRVPAFAAVNEAVTQIRAAVGEKVGGFANAILRKVAATPRPTEGELANASYDYAEPELREAIARAVGEEAARQLVGGAHLVVPPLGLRVEDASAREAWIARLAEARPNGTFAPGGVSPHAILARGVGRPHDLPGFAEGAFTPQEEGSQVVALALGAQPGDEVLDACAGRGNKTGLLARITTTDAVDVHPKKLERLERELTRIDARVRSTYAVDWTMGAGGIEARYDRILVDAPCSGTGTLRRRPEILLRRTGGDLAELAETQRKIFARAASLLKPGGRLVYAVCSVLREEAEDVVAIASTLHLVPAPFDALPHVAGVGEGETSFRLLPHVHDTDGYFIASFRRQET